MATKAYVLRYNDKRNLVSKAMRQLFLCFLMLLAAALPSAASAQYGDAPETQIKLYAERPEIVPGEPLALAVSFTVKPGWHLYWKNPGDTGFAPTARWSLPEGTAVDDFAFPTPSAFSFADFTNYGYLKSFDLLTEVTVPVGYAGETVDVGAKVEWLSCDDKICVPEGGDVAISLPVAQQASAAVDTSFAQIREALPLPADWAASAVVTEEDFVAQIDVPFMQQDVGAIQLFPETGGLIVYEAPQTVTWTGDSQIQIRIDAQRDSLPGPVKAVLKVTPKAGGPARGYALELAPSDFDVTAPTTQGGAVSALGLTASLPTALAFAFVGGLILNLMPCVFPVLSLKALSFAKSGGESAGAARAEGWFYTAGVVLSFLALAGVLLGLRAAGSQLGWGFQLQSPVMVAALALVMFVVGLNLLGAFEVSGRLAGVGQSWLSQQSGGVQSFATGVLATVVATPCTAPFMATALSFALTQPAPAALLIFFCLGFGLALPFLLLSYIPALQRRLPKPGAWMDTFKQLLAFPMFATMLWLLWVLSNQSGSEGVLLTSAIALLIGFALWALQRGRGVSGKAARLYPAAALGALVIAALGFAQIDYSRQLQEAVPADLSAETFSEARLADLSGGDAPVFVYFTADWCITCKANERLALKTETVRDAFAAAGVKTLVADWTRRDEKIAAVLARYGRAGVPLYLFYPAGSREPIELPQILRPGMLTALVQETGV